jgi:acetyl esterase/lipase
MLIDMIRDFAATVRNQGCDITLDVWEHMTHDFQAYGHSLAESREALERIAEAIHAHTATPRHALSSGRATEIATQR